MKLLCYEKDPAICESLKEQLDEAGIACLMKSEQGDSLFKASKKPAHELWIVNDAEFEKAWSLLNEHHAMQEEPDAD
jgi:hypothetical protein